MGILRSTPIILRDKEGNIILKKIGDIRVVWFYNINLGIDEGILDYEIWTYKGWVKVIKIIRYKTKNDIFKVMTSYGIICTDNKDIDYIYGPLPFIDKNYNISKLNMSEKQMLHYLYGFNEMNISLTEKNIIKTVKDYVNIGKTDTYLYDIDVDIDYYHAGIGNVNVLSIKNTKVT
jgi:hypothetical protein